MLGGRILKCCISHLAARMILKQFLEEHPFWEGGGLLWCELSIFLKHLYSAKCPFFYSHFLYIILVPNLLCGMEI